MVEDGHGFRRASALGRCQRDEQRVPVPAIRLHVAVLDDAVDLEGHLQVNLHLFRRSDHPIRDAVPPPDRAIGGVEANVQVIERDVPPCTLGGVRTPQCVRVGEDRGALRTADSPRAQPQERQNERTAHGGLNGGLNGGLRGRR